MCGDGQGPQQGKTVKWREILEPYRKCAGAVQAREPRVCPAGGLAIGF
jgi:hypothetical protein